MPSSRKQGWITVKGPMRGLTRIEWEKEIPAGEAQLLLSLCEPGVIDKTRHLVPAADGHVTNHHLQGVLPI